MVVGLLWCGLPNAPLVKKSRESSVNVMAPIALARSAAFVAPSRLKGSSAPGAKFL